MATEPKAWMVTYEARQRRGGWVGRTILRLAEVNTKREVEHLRTQRSWYRNVSDPLPLYPQSAIDEAVRKAFEKAARHCDELVAQLKVAEVAAEKAQDYEGVCDRLTDQHWPKRLAETFRGLACAAGLEAMGFTKVPEAPQENDNER